MKTNLNWGLILFLLLTLALFTVIVYVIYLLIKANATVALICIAAAIGYVILKMIKELQDAPRMENLD